MNKVNKVLLYSFLSSSILFSCHTFSTLFFILFSTLFSFFVCFSTLLFAFLPFFTVLFPSLPSSPLSALRYLSHSLFLFLSFLLLSFFSSQYFPFSSSSMLFSFILPFRFLIISLIFLSFFFLKLFTDLLPFLYDLKRKSSYSLFSYIFSHKR